MQISTINRDTLQERGDGRVESLAPNTNITFIEYLESVIERSSAYFAEAHICDFGVIFELHLRAHHAVLIYLRTKETNIEDLLSQLEAYKRSEHDVRAQIAQSQRSGANALRDRDTQIATLQDHLRANETNIQTLQGGLSASRRSESNLQAQLTQSTANATDALSDALSDRDAQIATLKDQLRRLWIIRCVETNCTDEFQDYGNARFARANALEEEKWRLTEELAEIRACVRLTRPVAMVDMYGYHY
jgi:chromosome segregation ATPase